MSIAAATAISVADENAPFRKGNTAAAARRQPRLRCLSVAENGHRATEAAAYDAMATGAKAALRDAKGKLKPPPARPPLATTSVGAAVLQQEIRRGIVAKDRNGNLLAYRESDDT
jgi:hypothetical protein